MCFWYVGVGRCVLGVWNAAARIAYLKNILSNGSCLLSVILSLPLSTPLWRRCEMLLRFVCTPRLSRNGRLRENSQRTNGLPWQQQAVFSVLSGWLDDYDLVLVLEVETSSCQMLSAYSFLTVNSNGEVLSWNVGFVELLSLWLSHTPSL